jgi:hypothetical protein
LPLTPYTLHAVQGAHRIWLQYRDRFFGAAGSCARGRYRAYEGHGVLILESLVREEREVGLRGAPRTTGALQGGYAPRDADD